MIAGDVISSVTKPTDWVNSITCNIKETPESKKKIRLCLEPEDLNKYLCQEHYYTHTCTIDEHQPQLLGKTFSSVVDTKKGYWQVAFDHESSLLQYAHLIPPLDGTTFGVKLLQTSSNTNLMR